MKTPEHVTRWQEVDKIREEMDGQRQRIYEILHQRVVRATEELTQIASELEKLMEIDQ